MAIHGIISEYDCGNRYEFTLQRNVVSDEADWTSSGRLFHPESWSSSWEIGLSVRRQWRVEDNKSGSGRPKSISRYTDFPVPEWWCCTRLMPHVSSLPRRLTSEIRRNDHTVACPPEAAHRACCRRYLSASWPWSFATLAVYHHRPDWATSRNIAFSHKTDGRTTLASHKINGRLGELKGKSDELLPIWTTFARLVCDVSSSFTDSTADDSTYVRYITEQRLLMELPAKRICWPPQERSALNVKRLTLPVSKNLTEIADTHAIWRRTEFIQVFVCVTTIAGHKNILFEC